MHVIHKDVFEILEEFNKADNKSARVDVLKKYSDHAAFKDILRGTFDDSLEFLLPEGKPPYTPNRPESTPSTLRKQHKQFGMFIKGGPGAKLPAYKREGAFIRLLESIHPKDAEVVLSMTQKKSPTKYLTKKLVQEVLPELIKN